MNIEMQFIKYLFGVNILYGDIYNRWKRKEWREHRNVDIWTWPGLMHFQTVDSTDLWALGVGLN